MQQFNEYHQPLRSDSLADVRLRKLDAELQATAARYKMNKLTQFDELATLYNRALLSKIVTPIVEKVRATNTADEFKFNHSQTMSDKESYRDIISLDAAVERGRSDFVSGATKPLALPDSEDHVKVGQHFCDIIH
jgi:hypothetical protein